MNRYIDHPILSLSFCLNKSSTMEIPKLVCDLCQASFTLKSYLQKHLNNHVLNLKEEKHVFSLVNPLESTKMMKFTCDLCRASFTLKDKLQ